ncbi:hypothetical protein SOD_c36170 [Serratia plymuthica 4Rx13]|uniref:Uncharacterized protein n=1 Tax=Serratia plymuthica TaxID=82996 RepID=A0A318NRQ2_SERPL|nr:hypothetical protein SOD_c36170 [Serratia plymuthica 4Rx13]PYD36429.1 hypothetical protein CT690_24135 [Serratia plymuthica]
MTDDYQPYRKGAVFAKTGPCKHLHIVCNDPVYYPINDCFCILVVNVSSVKFGVPHDDSCILNAGDHGFIHHESYVVYHQAAIWRVDGVVEKHANGELEKHHEDFNELVFQRVLNGFDISERVSITNHRFWRKYCS